MLLGCSAIAFYTESYASQYAINREKAIAPYKHAAQKAKEVGLGINAGHDLSLENLRYFMSSVQFDITLRDSALT